MVVIDSLSSISDLKKDIKKDNLRVISNFLLPASDQVNAIKEENLFFLKSGNTNFIFYKSPRSYRLFYFSLSFSSLEEDLKNLSLSFSDPVILEEITRNEVSPIQIKPSLVLTRLHRDLPSDFKPSYTAVPIKADISDAKKIEEILCNNFDPVCERVPDISELSVLIDNGDVAVVKSDNNIKGLLISNMDNQQLHLRYWWVSPEKRGNGIGSSLINYYFQKAFDINAKGLFLWVDVNNVNAINRYSHFGFLNNNRFDFIYRIQ